MNALIPLRPRGCPPRTDPRRWHELLAARIEWQLACVDRLMAALDRMDTDADLEPALGAPERHPRAWGFIAQPGEGSQLRWSDGDTLDLEEGEGDDEPDDPDEDGDPREDGGDREPSLGAPERGEYSSQVAWAAGSDSDLEGTDNALNGDPDMEPSMGWSNPGAPGDGPLPDGWSNALSGAGCDND